MWIPSCNQTWLAAEKSPNEDGFVRWEHQTSAGGLELGIVQQATIEYRRVNFIGAYES